MVETVYVHLEFADKTGGWSINLPFLCTQCGKCCILEDFLTAGPIKGTPETHPEAHAKANRLYKKLGDLWAQNEAEYDKHVASTPCPFLADNRCSIYEIRPEGCRQFPNTLFGMESTDCEALTRFKKQLAALKKGRKCTETYHHTGKTQETSAENQIRPTKFTQKQYQACITKLRKAEATNDEAALFESFNQ
ncbi:MAG: YkgJ family cysteine cluster protein [Candidatus Bathyarchaeota archaeon]|nr:YkgJ family cysteine cluster protein [Candidatus Bathyarchaeota archaeon]